MIAANYAHAVRIVRRTLAVLAAAALSGLLAGCGSYTRADFIARADAICASTLRMTRTIAPPDFGSTEAGQAGALRALVAYLARAAPLARSEATQLRALRRPAGSAGARAELDRYLAAVTSAAADYSALASAASRGDGQGVAAAEAALRSDPAASLAARYGLHVCGQAGATVT